VSPDYVPEAIPRERRRPAWANHDGLFEAPRRIVGYGKAEQMNPATTYGLEYGDLDAVPSMCDGNPWLEKMYDEATLMDDYGLTGYDLQTVVAEDLNGDEDEWYTPPRSTVRYWDGEYGADWSFQVDEALFARLQGRGRGLALEG